MHHKQLMMHDQNSRQVDSCPKREVRFGDTTLQRTSDTRHREQALDKLSDGRAFKPSRRGDRLGDVVDFPRCRS